MLDDFVDGDDGEGRHGELVGELGQGRAVAGAALLEIHRHHQAGERHIGSPRRSGTVVGSGITSGD